MQFQTTVGRACMYVCVNECKCVCVWVCVRACMCVMAAPLTHFGHTMGRMTMKSTCSVLSHARPLARALALNTHLLALHCSLRLRPPLRSFFCLLACPFPRSQAHGKGVFVCELNASMTSNFNPLWAARLCVYVCAFTIHPSMHVPCLPSKQAIS